MIRGNLKKFLFISLAAILLSVTGAYSNAEASEIQEFSQYLDPVNFWVLDDLETSDNGEVTLSIVNYGLQVDFSLDNFKWSTFANPSNSPYSSVTITTATKTMVYLRLVDGSPYDYSAQLIFSGFDKTYYDVDAYNSLTIKWNDTASTTITFATPQSGDDVAPVPIPATVWLLGAGLVAIVGIRRKGAE